MTLKLGLHAGPQNISMDDLSRLWRRADDAGFHWVSVWDHFYANPLKSRQDPCFEAVAAMAALAAMTSRVRVGCLVFCVLFRNPGLLAKAATTIDHISGGRADIGIGGGWFEEEAREYGYEFPPLGERLDQVEEAVQLMRSLWRDEQTDFSGNFYHLNDAVCSPKPRGLRLWMGGFGRHRTPRMAARYADGYNLPYLSLEDVTDRLQCLARACEAEGRDPESLDTSVNLAFHLGQQDAPEGMPAGALLGSAQQVIDRLGEYGDTGIKGVNIAIRPPVDWDAFECFIEEVLPAFPQVGE